MALEEIVPAADIDDILSQVSTALGMPNEADRADICKRGHKTMNDLKRELGPSLVDPVKQMQVAEADVKKAEELVSGLRRSAILQSIEASPVTDWRGLVPARWNR